MNLSMPAVHPHDTPQPGLRRSFPTAGLWFALALLTPTLAVAAPSSDEIEFFESRIRPVLAEHCYQCHNSLEKPKAGLVLDHRAGLLAGGDSGPAIIPGDPAASLLLRAIRHDDNELRMPKAGPKLDDEVVADFTRWIELGAPDPRDRAPTAEELAQATDWAHILERRRQWWSLQPVKRPAPPQVSQDEWSSHPVDRFILAKLEDTGLAPAPPADRAALLRRATFILTGLPPSSEETRAFLADDSPDAYEKLVDRLLDSPRFGERWARHWMDWFRFAESHGSEGDPSIPYAWRYRDYLIRALNADVPYDQLVREHLAGDLLPEPRLNEELGINESAIGPAHLRFVLHGFAPVDPLDEQVRFTENQVEVVGKALLGMTIACARCHHHKFDAISQEDFYALYGIMASTRPATVIVDIPDRLTRHNDRLRSLKQEIRQRLADTWLDGLADLPSRLGALPEEAGKDARSALHAWAAMRGLEGEAPAAKWDELAAASREALAQEAKRRAPAWNLAGDDSGEWFTHGPGLADAPSQAGEFHVLPEGDQAISSIYPAGVYTHLLSSRHSGVLTSPRFTVETSHLSIRALGRGGARFRMVVRNYPRAIGLLYAQHVLPDDDTMRWHHWNTTYWNGETAHLEAITAPDIPVEAREESARSWFGLAEVVFHNGGDDQPRDLGAPLPALAPQAAPRSADDLAELYVTLLHQAVRAWRDEALTDLQATFLTDMLRTGLLANTLTELPRVVSLVEAYRALEAQIPTPTRAPGVVESRGFDQPLFDRGNHTQPRQPVPRRFLEVFSDAPYETELSGRLELAYDIAAPDNPLTSRVIVNRLWHHVFGRGIVASTDNLGALGERPTHPLLLDYLAARFVEEGWSIKSMLRVLLTSQTFQMSAVASPEARRIDPANRLWSHMDIRRLEAESIRDAILAVSGQLDETMFGPSAPAPGSSTRRAVYVRVQRNNLDPFLSAFDAPEPYTTKGVRAATNVPAQSLTLLNDPFIIDIAGRWAQSMIDTGPDEPTDRLRHMFLIALSRPPTGDELSLAQDYLADLAAAYDVAPADLAQDVRIWRDIAQSIFNLKEFIYLR